MTTTTSVPERVPQPWGRPALRSAAQPSLTNVLRNPPLTAATLTWAGDRMGTARLDSGGSVDVRLPDVLWLRAGDRVLLYRYPDAWVAVLRYRFGPPVDVTEPRARRG